MLQRRPGLVELLVGTPKAGPQQDQIGNDEEREDRGGEECGFYGFESLRQYWGPVSGRPRPVAATVAAIASVKRG
jgi:hypothetical protein